MGGPPPWGAHPLGVAVSLGMGPCLALPSIQWVSRGQRGWTATDRAMLDLWELLEQWGN